MRRLIFVTQKVDPSHPALAATVSKISALARRVDEVVVFADGAVPGVLPPNCRVRRFRAWSKPGRGARFVGQLARELARTPKPLAVVAHMCPIYAVLAAPSTKARRVPLVLWYTHWHASRTLVAAERLASAVVSVDRRSFPLPSTKLTAIGHGIDVSEFACVASDGDAERLHALALGRYSPAKGLETVVRAVAQAAQTGVDVGLEVRGPVLSGLEREHRATLRRLVEALGVGDRVRLHDALPRSDVPELFARSDVLVNNMRAGAPDKVVYEAAASCLPVIASNPVFDRLLDEAFCFDRESADQLADRLAAFARLDATARESVGRALRVQVERDHSVDGWAERLLEVAETT